MRSFFAPLRGWYQGNNREPDGMASFRPLTGMVPTCVVPSAIRISFRPLTGMVLYDYQIKGFFKEFSPPYGDSTDITANNILFCKFSPPYGDSTMAYNMGETGAKFSPPYGDSTLCTSGAEWHNWFSPPYGDCTFFNLPESDKRKLSPPYGDGIIRRKSVMIFLCFRPLTGMVHR